jgi:hypothetical protein
MPGSTITTISINKIDLYLKTENILIKNTGIAHTLAHCKQKK